MSSKSPLKIGHGPFHTYLFLFENGEIGLPSTRIRWKRSPKLRKCVISRQLSRVEIFEKGVLMLYSCGWMKTRPYRNFNCLTITSRCWIPICAHAPIKDGIRLLHFRLQPFLVDNKTCRGGLKKKPGENNLRFHNNGFVWTEPEIMIDNDTFSWWGKRVTIGLTLYLVRSVETLY